MASKGKGKGKQSKCEMEIQKKQTIIHEGAMDNSYFIQGQMKNKEWYKARIIDCRLSKDYDPREEKGEASYEYYIHYENINRRNDEWVARNRIRPTSELIQEEPELKKKKKTEEKQEFEENDEHEGMDHNSLRMHEQFTRFKTIGNIEIGENRCETWYYSPYPSGYHNLETLFICEFCLNFYTSRAELGRHQCALMHPPGNEIYRHGNISVFEVDGNKNQTYCENLCYLSKLFLDHKNLYYDVEPFLFFLMCEVDQYGYHLVGYFSKEKESSQGYNLSCILVLPFHQRKGYGKFLISFSYALSMKENKVGTPERPLSDLGKFSYLAWWTQHILEYIQARNTPFSLQDITKDTMIRENDVLWSLEQKGIIKYNNGQIYVNTDKSILAQVMKTAGRPGLRVEIDKIHWVPFRFKYEPYQQLSVKTAPEECGIQSL